jgi:hypothetical protein
VTQVGQVFEQAGKLLAQMEEETAELSAAIGFALDARKSIWRMVDVVADWKRGITDFMDITTAAKYAAADIDKLENA